MRGRSWRRYKEKIKVIRRLKNSSSHLNYIKDGNKYIRHNYLWIELIGTYNHFLFKTTATNLSSSRYKQKWGKKGKNHRYHDSSPFTRVADKKFFKKMLKDDYGITKFNFNYESIENYTE
jgi:hypothetical protein